MTKKLRLLVTTDCPNKCPMCCNNSWDFDKLPIVDKFDYDEIMITGGEPMLFLYKIYRLAEAIKVSSRELYGKVPKIYIYTSRLSMFSIAEICSKVDGFVFIPHSAKDVEDLIQLSKELKTLNRYIGVVRNRMLSLSLRLNILPEIEAMIPKDLDLSMWKIKHLKWIKDCPVPEGEDFRRIKNLWHEQ